MTKQYELLFIIAANYAEDELTPIVEEVRAIVTKNNGEIIRDEVWGKRKLAYPIQHINHGYYILQEFNADTSSIKSIDNLIKLVPDVLRHIIVSKTDREIEEERKMQKRMKDKNKNKKIDDEEEKVTEEKTETISSPTNEVKKIETEIKPELTKKKIAMEQKVEKLVIEKEPESPLKKEVEKPKMTIEEVDKKLDEILEQDAL